MQIVDGRFRDERWVNGRWDLSRFAGKDGETDWDLVSDAGCCFSAAGTGGDRNEDGQV
jgi:hypothetical protein